MKYETPETMCMSVVVKGNIILNGLWTEVLLYFFFCIHVCCQQCTEMDEYLEARITYTENVLRSLNASASGCCHRLGIYFHRSAIKNYSLLSFGLHCLLNKNVVGHSFERGQFLFIKYSLPLSSKFRAIQTQTVSNQRF